jgi:hypothetical protein
MDTSFVGSPNVENNDGNDESEHSKLFEDGDNDGTNSKCKRT